MSEEDTSPAPAWGLVQRVADELSIRRTLARLAQAQDDRDYAAFTTCFTDRVLLTEAAAVSDWEAKEISATELADLVFAALEQLTFSQHVVVNELIDIDGDEATCSADLFGMSARSADEQQQTSLGAGRYTLRLQRVGEDWLIRERGLTMRHRHRLA